MRDAQGSYKIKFYDFPGNPRAWKLFRLGKTMRLNAQISTGVLCHAPPPSPWHPTNGCVNKWGVAITLKSNDQSFVFISQDTLPWLSIPTPQSIFFLRFFWVERDFFWSWTRQNSLVQVNQSNEIWSKRKFVVFGGVIAGGHGRNWKKQSYVVLGTAWQAQ